MHVCESFVVAAPRAVTLSCLGSVHLLLSHVESEWPSGRPEATLDPAMLCTIGRPFEKCTSCQDFTVVEASFENVAVGYSSASGYRQPVALSQPVPVGAAFSSSRQLCEVEGEVFPPRLPPTHSRRCALAPHLVPACVCARHPQA